jgi:hypothetical protein
VRGVFKRDANECTNFREKVRFVDKESGGGHNEIASFLPAVPEWRNWQTR